MHLVASETQHQTGNDITNQYFFISKYGKTGENSNFFVKMRKNVSDTSFKYVNACVRVMFFRKLNLVLRKLYENVKALDKFKSYDLYCMCIYIYIF